MAAPIRFSVPYNFDSPRRPKSKKEMGPWAAAVAKAIRKAIGDGASRDDLDPHLGRIWDAIAGVSLLYLPAAVAREFKHNTIDSLLLQTQGELVHHVLEMLERLQDSEPVAPAVLTQTDKPAATKSKQSTERGDGQTKLIGALTEHHKYANGSVLNPMHVGNNELAKKAGVSPSTASAFFNAQFDGHTKYKAICRDSGKLAAALKMLNGEFAPSVFLGIDPPEKGE